MTQLVDSTVLDRLPPHDLEAEKCLLASLMLANGDPATFAAVRAMLPPDAFYQADHQTLYTVMLEMVDHGSQVDAVILKAELVRRGLLEEIGGTVYLHELLHSVPDAAHWRGYAGILREKFLLREIIRVSNDAVRRVYSPSNEDIAGPLAMKLASEFTNVATIGAANTVHKFGDVLVEMLDRKEHRKDARVATGIPRLDRIIGGLRFGGKTLIGAKPGMGKSLLLKQLARNLAGAGVPVGLISIEESRFKVAENLTANESGIPNNRIAFGTMNASEWQQATDAVVQLAKLPLFIVDTARRLSSIVAEAHKLALQHGCRVVLVDHLHIIDGETDEHREREISKISAELKWVWKRLEVAGVEAAQLNRKSGNEPPSLDSLRDSGSLEQDADVVMLLHRDDYYVKDSTQHNHILKVHVAKNKDGAPAEIELNYDGARQRVLDPDETPDPVEPF